MIHIIYIILNANASTRPSDLVFEDETWLFQITILLPNWSIPVNGFLEYLPLNNEEKTLVW